MDGWFLFSIEIGSKKSVVVGSARVKRCSDTVSFARDWHARWFKPRVEWRRSGSHWNWKWRKDRGCSSESNEWVKKMKLVRVCMKKKKKKDSNSMDLFWFWFFFFFSLSLYCVWLTLRQRESSSSLYNSIWNSFTHWLSSKVSLTKLFPIQSLSSFYFCCNLSLLFLSYFSSNKDTHHINILIIFGLNNSTFTSNQNLLF